MGGLPSGAGALVGQRLGKYELLALLALGGTAEIYLARIDGTAGFEKYVVVKCLHDHLAEDQEFVSMFLDEARLGAQLDHSNIVQTLALGEHDGRYYLVMEYIAGLSLALVGRRAHERVRGGKVPVPIVLNVAAQACAGLHYAHERTEGGQPLNLVHRDISPQNLVITYEGIVKVVDFGIAKAEYRETRTRSGTVKGKFAYMSPEQCQAGDVDRRTDVFALGVIVWELLTGRRLFKRDSTYETYQAVVACNVPPPSAVNHELDPALDDIVMRALAKDRARRYPTAEAFGEALMGYLHHRGKPSGPGEIARFFEECFAREVEEQFVRMRELIEGRQKSLADQKLLQWDSSELDGSASSSMLDADDLEEIVEDSVQAPRPSAVAAVASGAIGPVSPPMARATTTPARPAAAPASPPTAAMRPLGAGGRAPSEAETLAVEDDFDGGQTTDAEGDLPDDATRVETGPQVIAGLAAGRRATTGTDPDRGRPSTVPDGIAAQASRASTVPDGIAARGPRAPTAPPRKVGVVTPPGLRAHGAPLDLSPHEQEQMLAMATPPPTAVPPSPEPPTSPSRPAFGPPSAAVVPTVLAEPQRPAPRASFKDAPTVIAPEAAPAARRFADAPTVLVDGQARPGPGPAAGPAAGRFADAPTVHGPGAAPAPGPAPATIGGAFASDPPTGETQMLGAEDLIEMATAAGSPVAPDAAAGAAFPGAPHAPGADGALPVPAHLIGLPEVQQVFPDDPRLHQVAARPVPRTWPPWLLAVMFVVVLAAATGITVALARALR